MTVTTTLDARSYFCAIWVQNELRSQRLMLPVRIGLVAVVLLVTFLLLPFRTGKKGGDSNQRCHKGHGGSLHPCSRLTMDLVPGSLFIP